MLFRQLTVQCCFSAAHKHICRMQGKAIQPFAKLTAGLTIAGPSVRTPIRLSENHNIIPDLSFMVLSVYTS